MVSFVRHKMGFKTKYFFFISPNNETFKPTIEGFSYDLEMKTHEQNKNNKQMEIERFDWFIKWILLRNWLLIGF